MTDILIGIVIGISIETVGLIGYIIYKRRQTKPAVTYDEVFDINNDIQNRTTNCISTPPEEENNAIDYSNL